MPSESPSANRGPRMAPRVLPLLGIPLLIILACNVSLGAQPPTPAAVTALVTARTPTATTEVPATSVPTVLPATAGPACVVQQSVNLRSGPGTAYDPPLASLDAGTDLIPTAFDAQGVPGGSWVQVQVRGQEASGWVSAGSQYISCTMDPASLPQASVAAPPPPSRPVVSAGAPDGSNFDLFRYKLDFNSAYLLRMYVFSPNDPGEKFAAKKDGRGIASVKFTITSANGDVTYYDRTEKNAGYCVFGGGEPDCSPWIVEGGRYKWKAGGQPVKSGKYGLTITVTAENGDVGVWLWNSNSHNAIVIDVP